MTTSTSTSTSTYTEYVVPRGDFISLEVPQRYPKWTGQSIGNSVLVGFFLHWHYGLPMEICYVFDAANIQSKIRAFRDTLVYAISRTGNIEEIKQRLVREGMLVMDTVSLILRSDIGGLTELKYVTTNNTFVVVTSSLIRIQLSVTPQQMLEWCNHLIG